MFPYYSEKDITDEALQYGIKVYYGEEGERELIDMGVDVILVGTYHRILSQQVCESAELCLNFHPSLLPKYKGANPFYHVIINNESKTGITVHKVTKEIDGGDILLQRTVVLSQNETQGSLRQRLAKISGEMAIEVMLMIEKNETKFYKQMRLCNDEHRCISPNLEEIDFSIYSNFREFWAILRAKSPWPGVVVDGKVWVIQERVPIQ